MFSLLDNKIRMVYINPNYLKSLYNACSQVFYVDGEYIKPYVGILICNNDRLYCIPISSAKKKTGHNNYAIHGKIIIYEDVKNKKNNKTSIYILNNNGTYKHLLSELVIYKMIPIKEGLFTDYLEGAKCKSNTNISKYKKLLQKEFDFCVKHKSEILNKATKIYNKQINTGLIKKYHVDFKKLEAICDSYTE